MGIFDSDDKIQKWRYNTNTIELLIPGEEVYKIPKERITGLYLLNEYESYCYPVFKIDIVLESSIYYKIIKNKKNVQFHLRIQKYYHYSDSEEKSLYRDYINDTFSLILDDEDEDILASLKEEESKNDYENIYSDKNSLTMTDNKIELFLYKTDVIKRLKNNVNKILYKCNITDAICYIMTVAKINNVLMSKPDNTNEYEDLIIPPLTCLKALKFLDTYYGIYKTGSMIYFDFDYSYILKYDGNCTAYVKNESQNTNIIIPKKSSSHSTECGMLMKGNNNVNYVIAEYKTVGIRNDSVSNDVINSNDIEFVDNLTGDVTASKSNATTIGNENSSKIVENLTENAFIGQTYTTQTSANDTVIEVNLYDFDVDALAPNKKYSLIFEDNTLTEKYNGVYLLSSLENNFIQDGADFCINSIARFKKVK